MGSKMKQSFIIGFQMRHKRITCSRVHVRDMGILSLLLSTGADWLEGTLRAYLALSSLQNKDFSSQALVL